MLGSIVQILKHVFTFQDPNDAILRVLQIADKVRMWILEKNVNQVANALIRLRRLSHSPPSTPTLLPLASIAPCSYLTGSHPSV